jgi:hypothetical protein
LDSLVSGETPLICQCEVLEMVVFSGRSASEGYANAVNLSR